MITNIKKINVLYNYIISHWRFLEKYDHVKKFELLYVLFLGSLTVFLEAVGLSILIPLLSFIENNGDLSLFKESSILSNYISIIFSKFNINISLMSLSIAAITAIIFRQLINYFNTIENERLKWKVNKRISVSIFKYIMASPLAYFQDVKSGHFLNIATNEANQTAAILRSYGAIWMTIMVIIAYGTLLLLTAPKVTVVVSIFLAIIALFLSNLMRINKKLSDISLKYRLSFHNFLSERFSAWRLITLSNTIEAEIENAKEINSNIFNNQIKLLKISGLIGLLFIPLASIFLLISLNLFVSVLDIELAVIMTFGLAFVRLMPVVLNFQSNINKLITYFPSYKYFEKIYIETYSRYKDSNHGEELKALKKDIIFKDVSFKYDGRKDYVFKKINFSIKAGSFISIIGHSGVGKSTLMDLVPRIIEPNDGTIFYDGIDIKNASLNSLRSKIVYVPQEPFLFNSTIIENLTYVKNKATHEELWEALKLANADTFVSELPDKLDTNIGSLGKKMSGGQRQRLVLARAFLSNASIVILDEPTSSLDMKSDLKIQESINILKKKEDLTIILITHKKSNLELSDTIYELNNGIIERKK
tara:strand:- start:6007 stop:7776 length:1770 start_codon:yes stop_codon:yes gene_type:complete